MTPSTRRLQKEANELLSTQASPSIHAAPVDDNLFDWHFTIAGPPAPSPYSEGIYHGRIVLPPTYPLRPPSFRFLTPSGRFEVNREICLSISGHHEESWQPAWGIRTALLAIRSFMDADANGQVGGLDVSEEVRREYARQSRAWVCDVCGESNERVLQGWREDCRERGMSVDDDDKDKNKDNDGQQKANEEEGNDENVDHRPGTPTSAAATTATAPAPAVSPSPASTPAEPSTSEAPEHRPPANIVRPIQAATTQGQASDGLWLDRAIIGVSIALIFMILRRFVSTDEQV